MSTLYIAHLPLVFLHTAFIRPPSFLVLQKYENQNANMNIYYIISILHFVFSPLISSELSLDHRVSLSSIRPCTNAGHLREGEELALDRRGSRWAWGWAWAWAWAGEADDKDEDVEHLPGACAGCLVCSRDYIWRQTREPAPCQERKNFLLVGFKILKFIFISKCW